MTACRDCRPFRPCAEHRCRADAYVGKFNRRQCTRQAKSLGLCSRHQDQGYSVLASRLAYAREACDAMQEALKSEEAALNGVMGELREWALQRCGCADELCKRHKAAVNCPMTREFWVEEAERMAQDPRAYA